jgi:hypothetical protein
MLKTRRHSRITFAAYREVLLSLAPAIIRVFDESGTVIETHESAGFSPAPGERQRYEIPTFEKFVRWAKKQPKRQLEATD